MQFPLSLTDLSLWFAVTSIILITTAEFILPYYGKINLLIDKSRFRTAAIALGILFLLTALIDIFEIAPTVP